jgi:hypothetical protein
MGILILFVGLIVALVGLIMVAIPAFKDNIWWGLGTLFLFVPVGWIYAFMHWQDAKKGFLIWVVGFVVYIVGLVIGGAEFLDNMEQMNENMQDPQFQ